MNNEQNDSLQKLREPFPASSISQLPKGGALLDYVGHAETTDRLLNADPMWTWEPFATDERGLPAMETTQDGKPVGLWIRLTVCGVTRIGYGSCLPTKSDAAKELIGDAIRNAAMRFGVALDLWAKADLESGNNGETHDARPRQNAGQPQTRPQAQSSARAPQNAQNGTPVCPKCSGPVWDNRAKKESGAISPKSPDFKCKDRENCDGAIWPPKDKPAPQQQIDSGPTLADLEEAFAQDAAYPAN